MTTSNQKRILLIDLDDGRRDSRINLLQGAGYEVDVRQNYIAAERLDDEGTYDLVIVALHHHPELTAAYSDHLTRNNPTLPIILLPDWGIFVPKGTLSPDMQSGDPVEFMAEIAKMLAGSTHLREVPVNPSSQR